MSVAPDLSVQSLTRKHQRSSQDVLRTNVTNELVFAVVGHVGSGTSTVCELLRSALEDPGLRGGAFQVRILKASDVIRAWAKTHRGRDLKREPQPELKQAQELQDLGDAMRESGDHAAVAKELVREVQSARRVMQGATSSADSTVAPDGARRAYVLDSLRHPAEVFLLRNLYQSAFTLVGVVCDEEARLQRLTSKFSDAGQKNARQFMARDRSAKEKHGQRVERAFHLADFFVDNSIAREKDKGVPNHEWKVPEHLSRLLKIVTHSEIIRPFSSETAMYVASGAERRSACLSRQVGAALLDRAGNVVATGTNEVPRAGGGVYGQGFAGREGDEDRTNDHRCFLENKQCSNTLEQTKIVEELVTLLETVPGMGQPVAARREALTAMLRESRIGELLEFSRAVHAEMDALLSAARKGVSPVGMRMFVTTFPCHYCARHIVTAGIDEVQYIEAYPKSRALSLHKDSIADKSPGWTPPSSGEESATRVLFRPFVGVAPRLYARAFLKDRELKNKDTGAHEVGDPEWGGPWDIGRLSYLQLENELLREGQ